MTFQIGQQVVASFPYLTARYGEIVEVRRTMSGKLYYMVRWSSGDLRIGVEEEIKLLTPELEDFLTTKALSQ